MASFINPSTRSILITSSLLDHTLTNPKESVTRHGVITLGLSDLDLIFCTRKTKCFKSRKHNTISVRTYKNYSKTLHEEGLTKMKIPNYLLFSYADSAYNSFSKILQDTINDIASIKNIRKNTKPWFDNNMIGLIREREKLKKRFLHTKLHVYYEYSEEKQNIVQREIKRKKANYDKEQLKKNTKNPKELWKALKNLGMQCKYSQQPKICLRENNLLQFNEKKNANTLKDFYRNLAVDLVN